MTARIQSFDTFASQSAALHKTGLDTFGKRYKQWSNRTLTSIFFNLIERLSVSSAIEVGAFKGEFSCRFKREAMDRAVIAIEANPYNFNEYKDSLESAGVIYHHAAILDRSGPTSLQLSVTERDIQNGYIRGNNSILSNGGRIETRAVSVPGETLDSLVTMYVKSQTFPDPALSPPVLWIDAEGALNLVIQGGHRTIQNSVAIFAEVETDVFWEGQSTFPEICNQLDELGFFPYLRDCEYEPEQFNVIFLNRQLANESWTGELSDAFVSELQQLNQH